MVGKKLDRDALGVASLAHRNACVVSDLEMHRFRNPEVARQMCAGSDEAVLEAPADIPDDRIVEDQRVLELGILHEAAVADRQDIFNLFRFK